MSVKLTINTRSIVVAITGTECSTCSEPKEFLPFLPKCLEVNMQFLTGLNSSVELEFGNFNRFLGLRFQQDGYEKG